MLAGSIALSADASEDLHRFEAVEPHMGTLARIVVYVADEQSARDTFAVGFDRVRALEAVLSDYRPDSELNRLAFTAVERPTPVSADLFAVLRVAQEVAEATDGAFDITQGPVTRLWREARSSGRLPDATALEDAAARSGFRRLTLDETHGTATMAAADMALDAGGIGKGYAASEALAAITRLGVGNALVAVSGDIAVSAAPPGQRGWRIALSSGSDDDASARQTLELEHAAVSTSGAGAQHLDVDGQRYSHIVNPVSGMGLRDDIVVTVIAKTGAEADALATAVSVLGVERGLRVLDARPGVAGVIVTRVGTDARVYRSARWPVSGPGNLSSHQ